MESEKDFVIFTNNPSKKYWEISGPMMTTYMMYEIVSYEYISAMHVMLMMHGIPNIKEVCKTMIEYTNSFSEDMFMIEL